MENNVTPPIPPKDKNMGIRLQPFIAAINYNTLTYAKAIQIVHTLMENFCHRDKDKVSQFDDMGNNACLLMGYHNKVSSERFLQIILVMNNLFHCLTQVWTLRNPLLMTRHQLK